MLHQLLLQVSADAVKHLELESSGRNFLLAGELFGRLNHVLVMSGDAVVDAALEQHLHQLHVIRVHFWLFLKGDGGRFFVGSFAEPDANFLRSQFGDIRLAALHVCLYHRSHMAAVAGLAMELINQVQGPLRVGRAFHIHAHKVSGGGGFFYQVRSGLKCQARIDVKAHVGQLQAHIGVQLACGNRVQHLVVESRALARFINIGHILAKIIHAYAHT